MANFDDNTRNEALVERDNGSEGMEMTPPDFAFDEQHTEEEFLKFNRFVRNKFFHGKRSMVIVNVWYSLLNIFYIVILFFMNNMEIWILLGLFVCLQIYYNYKAIYAVDKNARKVYRQNKILAGIQLQLSFWKDHYKVKTNTGSDRIAYKNLFSIEETDTNFYLMFSKQQGQIVVKDKAPEGFTDFMRGIKQHYKL